VFIQEGFLNFSCEVFIQDGFLNFSCKVFIQEGILGLIMQRRIAGGFHIDRNFAILNYIRLW
jgi:hypothetical protein